MSRAQTWAALGVAGATASLLVAEIASLRVWKVALGQDVAFVAVPAALFGTALGAALASHGVQRHRLASAIPWLVALWTIASPLALALPAALGPTSAAAWSWWPVLAAGLCALGSYAALGAALALAFASPALMSSGLYAASLAGGALGALGAWLLMAAGGPPLALLAVVATGAVGAACLARARGPEARPRAVEPLVATLALAALAGALVGWPPLGPRARCAVVWSAANAYAQVTVCPMSVQGLVRGPAGPVPAAAWSAEGSWQRPDRAAQAASHGELAAAGGTGTIAGGQAALRVRAWQVAIDERQRASSLVAYEDLEQLAFLRQDASALAFQAATPGHAAILGAGGGLEVLQGLLAGWPSLTAIELNPLMLDAARALGAERVWSEPGVRLVIEEARSFLRRGDRRYDLILLPNVKGYGGVSLAGLGFAENYLLTREAFSLYLDRLAPGGVLALRDVRWTEPWHRATLAAAIAARGGTGQGLLLRGPQQLLVLYAADGLDPQRLAALSQGAAARRYRLETFWPAPPGAPGGALVASDDRPYVYALSQERFLTRSHLPGDRARAAEPAALPLAGLGLLALVYLGVALLVTVVTTSLAGRRPGLRPLVAHVALTGLGFMAAELALIERLAAATGHPAAAAAVILAVLLAAGGFGCLLAARSAAPRAGRLAAGALALLLPLTWLSAERLSALTPSWALLPLAALLVLPAGLLSGIPFASALAACRGQPQGVPVLWASNGAAAVAGGVGAKLLSIALGLRAAMALAVLAYLLAALVLALRSRTPDAGPSDRLSGAA